MNSIDPMHAALFVESGPLERQTYALSPLASPPHRLLIGRLETCYVRFPPDARMVGREHACIVARPEGIFLMGLHQNGTLVDGDIIGQSGETELRYGARIEIGQGGPVLVVREQAAALPPLSHSSGTGTQYSVPRAETEQDFRAEIEALKQANRELDRQNQQLRAEKDSLSRQLQNFARPSPSPAPSASSDATALFQRFSQGLLSLQKTLKAGSLNQPELDSKLDLIIFDLDELHCIISK